MPAEHSASAMDSDATGIAETKTLLLFVSLRAEAAAPLSSVPTPSKHFKILVCRLCSF